MDIQVKRGPENKRTNFTPKAGEPVFTTDEKELYIGDGATEGGVPVGTVRSEGVSQGQVAIFKDASGKLLEGKSEADIIQGLATQDWVKQTIAGDAVDIKIKAAESADKATDSDNLGGHPSTDYVRTNALTDSYTETSKTKVVSAFGIDAAVKWLKGLIDGLVTSKLDKSALSSSLGSTLETKAATSKAAKDLNDRITTVQGVANTAKTTADSAKATADSAKSSATSVASTAQSALTAAQGAASKADNAESTANRAISTANTATVKANSVESVANGARDTANNALNAANSAKQTASSASSTASAAQTAAQTADGKAAAAQTTANQANQKATTNAGHIQTAQTTANQAKSAAQLAQSSADSAKVGVTQAKSAASTAQNTANQAKTTATSALNKANANAAHLAKLPGQMTHGTGNPSGGSDGDVYIQYK